MADVNIRHEINISGAGNNEKIKELEEALSEARDDAASLRNQLRQIGEAQTKKSLGDIAKAVDSISTAQKGLAQQTQAAVDAFQKQIQIIAKSASILNIPKEIIAKNSRIANTLQARMFQDDELSDRQSNLLSRQIERLSRGEISQIDFARRAGRISAPFAKRYQSALEKSSMSANELKLEQTKYKYADKIQKAENEKIESAARINAAQQELNSKLETEAEKRKVINEQLKQQQTRTEEQAKQEQSKTAREQSKAANAYFGVIRNYINTRDAYNKDQAKEERRQQKMAQNERAWATMSVEFNRLISNGYEETSESILKAELASRRLVESMRNIKEYAATKGYTGTIGLESTDKLRAQQYHDAIMKVAVEWKSVNSSEAHAADFLGKMTNDWASVRETINRTHTAMGQLASTTSAVAGIAKQLRQSFTQMAQPVIQMINRFTSRAFTDALNALKNLELSEIGFGNFFGEYAVSGIMNNIKQNAVMSPMSMAQLANYVNQIAPLSNGNATLATNAAMGVAKMIQYSGGEVSTEMEYVIRNLRDVISKGKATSIDIRQFNRAMPALRKVLQDMGLEEFLKNGELVVSKETAPKLLEAFQAINESEDVGSIFEKTSLTISGLIERLQEQMELFIIDVADFSGATKWIKETLSDILDDSNGFIKDLKITMNFIGNDIMRWVKSRDWERAAKTLGEIFEIIKTGVAEGISAIGKALGVTDWRTTLTDFAKVLANFIKGIANSYSWLIKVVKGLSDSGLLGSGLVTGAASVLGFMSGNAGTIITGVIRATGNALGVLNQTVSLLVKQLEVWTGNLLRAASTVATFDEAIAIASQASVGLAEDYMVMQQLMNGTLSQEQAKNQMLSIEARSRDRLIGAIERNIAAEEAETAANQAATASEIGETSANGMSAGGSLLGTMLGRGAGSAKHTALFSAVSSVLKVAITTAIVDAIGTAAGSGLAGLLGGDTYTSQKVGSVSGNLLGFGAGGAMTGFMLGGPMGALFGGLAGAVVGLTQSVNDFKAIENERREEELAEVESSINNGDYLADLLKELKGGNKIAEQDRDYLNSLLVKWTNDFNEAFPSGTAEELIRYLTDRSSKEMDIVRYAENAAEKWDKNATNLYALIKTGDVAGANQYAATLHESGYSSNDTLAMIMGQAFKDGLTGAKLSNLLLQWADVQTSDGKDLTYDYITSLINSGNAHDKAIGQDLLNQLENKFLSIGQDMVKDLNMSDDDKKKVSKEFATGFTKLITGQMGDMSEEEKMSISRMLIKSGVNAYDAYGISIDDWHLSEKHLQELYGFAENLYIWSNNVKKGFVTGATFDDSKVPEGLTGKDYWDWVEAHWDELETTTEDTIKRIVNKSKASSETIEKTSNDAAVKVYELSRTIAQLSTNSAEAVERIKRDPSLNLGGQLDHYANGGNVRGVDTVPAMLQPGEFVMRRSAVSKLGLSAMNAINTGDVGFFARALGRQNVYGDYSNARTWNNTSNDNRKSVRNIVKVYNNSKGARLNRYYSLANRLA